MTVTISRPGVLREGDEIRLDGHLHTVVALSGTSVRLVDVTGSTTVILLPQLLSDPTFALVGAPRAPLPPLGALEGLPDEVIEQAHWWERQIIEVLTGLPAGVEPGATAKPEYDPSVTTLRQRELAKLAELPSTATRSALRRCNGCVGGMSRKGCGR